MNYRKIRIFISILMMFFSILLIGCNKDKEEEPEDEKPIVENIEASHTVIDKDLNIYLLYQAKPTSEFGNEETRQSITIYSDFLKGNKVSRHYSYYQVDYNINKKTETYYHEFDFITDGTERSYAQNFLPYNKFDNLIEDISVLFEYSYMINGSETVYEEKCSFKEKLTIFDKNKDYVNSINDYIINIDVVSNPDEAYNRYKLNIDFLNDVELKKGHIDFTAFVEFSNGEVYPLYSLLHYNFDRDSYHSVSDTKIEKKYEIINKYYVLSEYLEDGTVNTIYYKE